KVVLGPGGYGTVESTYGGKLTENVVQALCRDLLADALQACERARLPVVLHAHDEIAVEVEEGQAVEALAELARVVTPPPPWADGFPVAVEAFACGRYTKVPPPEAPAVSARNGALVANSEGRPLPPVWRAPEPTPGPSVVPENVPAGR